MSQVIQFESDAGSSRRRMEPAPAELELFGEQARNEAARNGFLRSGAMVSAVDQLTLLTASICSLLEDMCAELDAAEAPRVVPRVLPPDRPGKRPAPEARGGGRGRNLRLSRPHRPIVQ